MVELYHGSLVVNRLAFFLVSFYTIAIMTEQETSVRNANTEYKDSLSSLERGALWITETVGTMGFFLIIFLWTTGWLVWNLLGPIGLRFDPYPAFVLWLFISNMIQLFLTPLIMIGQNLQGKHSEARAEADFEVNTKAESEIRSMKKHLGEQKDLLEKILQKLN